MNTREEIILELHSKSDHLIMELPRSEVNHENAGPERDEENNLLTPFFGKTGQKG
jgi:hypothetical protein